MAVRISLLGKVSIEAEGFQFPGFRSQKLPCLLGLLAYRRLTWSRDALATKLWPDSFRDEAKHSLRQVLFEFKQTVDLPIILADRTNLELRADIVTDIDELFDPGSNWVLDPHRQSLFDRPMSTFLEGFEADWIDVAREECSRAFVKGLLQRAQQYGEAEPERALAYLDRALLEEPFHEPTRAAKISLLKNMGMTVAAHRELADFSKMLVSSLGIEPSDLVRNALEERKSSPDTSVGSNTGEVELAIRTLLKSSSPLSALEMATATAPYWIESGRVELGAQILKEVLDFNANNHESLTHALGTIVRAELLGLSGKFSEASGLLLTILSQATTPWVRAKCLAVLAKTELSNFRLKTAFENAELGLACCDERDFPALKTDLLSTAAKAAVQLGRASEAKVLFDECQSRCIEQSDWLTHSNLLLTFAGTEGAHGNLDAASKLIKAGSTLVADKNSPLASATKIRVSRILEGLGNDAEAETGYRAGIVEARDRGDGYAEAIALTYLGDILFKSGRLQEALIQHSRALELRRELGEMLGIATSLRGLGRIQLASGQLAVAQKSLSESAQVFLSCGAEPGYVSALYELSLVARRRHEHGLALRLATRTKRLMLGFSRAEIDSIGPNATAILPGSEDLIAELSGLVTE